MSHERSIPIAVGISWANRAAGMLAGLLLTPVLFRTVSGEELGLWFLIAGSQPLLSLMGFGIAAVLTRHVALANGQGDGRAEPAAGRLDLEELAGTGRWLLRRVAVCVALVGLLAGAAVLRTVGLETVPWPRAMLAWGLYLLGYATTVWVSYFECLVIGTGRVRVTALIQLAASLLNIVAGGAVALAGGGLVGLACVNLALVLAQRGAYVWVVRVVCPDLRALRGRYAPAYARRLFRTAAPNWLNAVGVFVVMQSANYFVVALGSVGELPMYAAAVSLVYIPYQLAITGTLTSAPFISRAWQAGDRAAARRLALRAARFGLTFVVAAHGFAALAGEEFLRLWIGPDRFIGHPVLIALCCVYTLECAQYAMSFAGRATDDESYMVPVLLSAVLAPVLILFLGKHLGLLAIPVGVLIAQSLTANWYAVHRTVTRLEIGWGAYLRGVVAPAAGTLAGVLAVGGALTWWARANLAPGTSRDGLIVTFAALSSGAALAAASREWRAAVRPPRARLAHAPGAAP